MLLHVLHHYSRVIVNVCLSVCVCIKARSPRYGRQLLFLTKQNGGRTSFELRCTYEPHPPAQAGRMVRPHLNTSPLLLTHSFHLISSLLFFSPSRVNVPLRFSRRSLETTAHSRKTRNATFQNKSADVTLVTLSPQKRRTRVLNDTRTVACYQNSFYYYFFFFFYIKIF